MRADGDVGDARRRATSQLRWASVTKLLTGLAVLVAVEEGTVDLDEPAGPQGSTLRHLLAHASGLPPDEGPPLDAARSGGASTRTRASSSPAALVAERAGDAVRRLLPASVVEPLGLAGALARLAGVGLPRPARRPARARRASCSRRRSSRPRRSPRRPRCSSRASPACCRASAGWTRTTGGSRSSSATASRRTGRARTTRRARSATSAPRHVPLGRPRARARVRRADRQGVRRLGDRGLAALQATQSSANSGRRNSSNVARSQLATTAGVIAVHRRGARHVHRERRPRRSSRRAAARRACPSRCSTRRACRRGRRRSGRPSSPSRTIAVPGATSSRSIRLPSSASVSPGQPGEQLDRARARASWPTSAASLLSLRNRQRARAARRAATRARAATRGTTGSPSIAARTVPAGELDREPRVDSLLPGGAGARPAAAQSWSSPLVEPLALAEREERDLVAVVADEQNARDELLAVHAHVQPVPVCATLSKRARARERLAAAAVVLAPVDEPGVDAERDVVQEEPLVRRGRRRRAARRRRRTRRARASGSSRSRPTSRAKWFRVPNGTQTNGSVRARAQPPRRRRASRRRPPSRASRRRRRVRRSPGSSPFREQVRLDPAAARAPRRARRRSASRRPSAG